MQKSPALPTHKLQGVPRDECLDAVFHALSDRTRRAMIVRLTTGSATISELAAPFAISLPGASKHVRVLEKANLVARTVNGRAHVCELRVNPLDNATYWLAERRDFWAKTLASLDEYAQSNPRQRRELP